MTFCPVAPWRPITRWVSHIPLGAPGEDAAGVWCWVRDTGCICRTRGAPRSTGGVTGGQEDTVAEGAGCAGVGLVCSIFGVIEVHCGVLISGSLTVSVGLGGSAVAVHGRGEASSFGVSSPSRTTSIFSLRNSSISSNVGENGDGR